MFLKTQSLILPATRKKYFGWLHTCRIRQLIHLISVWLVILFSYRASAVGINWPANQLLPAFSTPVSTLDCADLTTASNADINLFASLQGIVNRSQPQFITVTGGDGEGKFTWITNHGLNYTLLANPYTAITKYRSYAKGLVVTDPNQPDTLNLATTIAGIKDVLICDPSLLTILTQAPYNLPIVDDLRGRFVDKYEVYNYLYNTYWNQTTHRMLSGMYPGIHGCLRDYLVAMKVCVLWLDPAIPQDAVIMDKFGVGMASANSVFVGWMPNEGSALTWLARYGIPIMPSDFYRNGSVFSGVRPAISVPAAPPVPALQNKIYVAMILSDGDNMQYMQHVMRMNWDSPARNQIPISWTVSALAADLDPGMLNYYWNNASANDCLISGPSGAGYAQLGKWSQANIDAYTSLSNGYFQRSGLRIATIWESLNSNTARSFARNCPTLTGLADQAGVYNGVDLGLRTINLSPSYPSLVSQLKDGITAASVDWDGSAPVFIAAQAEVWSVRAQGMVDAAATFDKSKYEFVRADHLFALANKAAGGAKTPKFLIVNKSSGKALDLIGGNNTNGAVINQWSYDYNGPNQRFAVLPTEANNHFKLVSGINYKCASIANDSTAAGAQLNNRDYIANNTSQQFDLIEIANGWFKIKNVKSGLILEVAASSTADNAKVQQSADVSGANQLWRLQPWGDYNIRSDSGKCICIQGSGSGNGSRIVQFDYENNPWFKWRFVNQGDGFYGLYSLNALTRVLCVEGGSSVPGRWCQLYDYIPSNLGDQKIRIVPQVNGTFKFYFKHDNQSWDIPGGQTGNNVELDQYTNNSNAWQNFRMERVR
jgi:GxGYxY sequence motif in domain of unknown function N-terminal/GxGYxYP putative glycoside hydrolase C-terminal domain/Ricin-type beta-trefoil lectin domain-like